MNQLCIIFLYPFYTTATRWFILVISQCGIINIATHRDATTCPPAATTNTTLTDLHTHKHTQECVSICVGVLCVCCVNSPAVHALSHVSGATEVVWVLRLLIINVVALYVTRCRLAVDSSWGKSHECSGDPPLSALVSFTLHIKSAINLQPFSPGKIFLMLCKVREFCFSFYYFLFFFMLLLLVLCVAQLSWRPLTL